jgi:hypothetical protein
MIDKKKRKEMEELVYGFFDLFDPTGRNTEYYRNKFKAMNDAEFDQYFKLLFAQEDPYLTATMVDYENPVQIENIEKAADFLNVPLFEKVVIPYASSDPNNPVITKHECMVGYLNIKRLQQINFKKLGLSTDVSERNMITGQVTGHDKNSRNSDAETTSLLTVGATDSLKEFMSARADDMVMKKEMNQKILRDGYVAMSDLTDKLVNKTTLNSAAVFFMGAGIMNDLITDDYLLPKTVEDQD